MKPSAPTNKELISRYMDGFRHANTQEIAACLSDDVTWDMPGGFHRVGKDAFLKESRNEAFVGSPTITLTRLVEEDNVVVAEGTVESKRAEGGRLKAVFCDVFTLEQGRIIALVSYLIELK
jgi:uncharacterized protein